jgi:hypothetical protein
MTIKLRLLLSGGLLAMFLLISCRAEMMPTSDHFLTQLRAGMKELVLAIERIKCNQGKYPEWNSNQFKEFLLSIEWFTTDYNLYNYFDKMDYSSNGDDVEINIITVYICDNCQNKTVIKIINGEIFWKNDVASDDDGIDQINWNKVNRKFAKIILDKNCNIMQY